MISIIIPVYNNNKTLKELTERLVKSLNNNEFEIIYINDGSQDSSLNILKELSKECKQIKIISFSRNFGQHPAISAGFEHALGDKIVLMDADLQDKPENIPLLLNNLKNDLDIVYTIRKDKKISFFRNITSRLFHHFVSKQVGVKIPGDIGTFRLFTRKVLDALLKYNEVKILYGPLMYYVGFNCCYVEVNRDERPNEKSSYSFLKRLELAVNTIITYTDLPYRIFLYVGSIILFGSVFYMLLVMLQYLFMGKMLPGGMTIIIVMLSFMIGSIIFCLGILGIYLFHTFQEVLHRPRYLIDEIIDNK
jgi:polyisoprenyl-phosphate glycosyltransferase